VCWFLLFFLFSVFYHIMMNKDVYRTTEITQNRDFCKLLTRNEYESGRGYFEINLTWNRLHETNYRMNAFRCRCPVQRMSREYGACNKPRTSLTVRAKRRWASTQDAVTHKNFIFSFFRRLLCFTRDLHITVKKALFDLIQHRLVNKTPLQKWYTSSSTEA